MTGVTRGGQSTRAEGSLAARRSAREEVEENEVDTHP